MDKVVVTGVLVKNHLGQVLLVKKKEGVGPYAGTYLTPGGGLHDSEHVDDCARRELYEETGVKVTSLKRVYFHDDITENWRGEKKHFIMLMFEADYESGELGPTEGDDDNLEVIKWFNKEEISKLPLSPPLKTQLKNAGLLES